MGYVKYVVYKQGSSPPLLPLAVLVQFDNYTGPSFCNSIDRLVVITPLLSETYHNGTAVERQQIPLKLCWAMTIHKSQGLTLSKAHIDVGMTEKIAGLAYVALSRVKNLTDLLLEPMPYERLGSVKNSTNFQLRIDEESRLDDLSEQTKKLLDDFIVIDVLQYLFTAA